jgi:hypothetical protein
MAKKKSETKVLPKAPLVEVVFELRWMLQEGPSGAPVLQSDPGLLPLLNGFATRATKAGFKASIEMSHPLQTGPYGVVRRFFRRSDEPFPILQVGPGIFASNEGPDYDWKSFKAQGLKGLRDLLDSYPKLEFFPLRPKSLELRYIDVFSKEVAGGASLLGFLASGTSMKLDLPPMLADRKRFAPDVAGRMILQMDLKERKGSKLVLDLGSAQNNLTKEEDIVRLETKVLTAGDGVPQYKTRSKFISDVVEWLDFAHDIHSPLFKELISAEVLKNFRIGK